MKMIEINQHTRSMIIECVDQAVITGGMSFKIGKATDKRSIEQNKKLHAMLGDISRQITHYGQTYSIDVWKRLTMAAWLREDGQQAIMIPAIDGNGVDVVFERSSKLSVSQMTAYIEWVTVYCVNSGVKV